ncbi:MAG: GNAT family protein [Mycobacterium sp.]|nr:GNAT family protein [Mycobacterium sp.]
MTAIWPLFDLEVSTPRLSLRYVTDDLGAQLAGLAAQGIHDPATMPFAEPWTDVPAPELQRNAIRYYWRCRAETYCDHWDLNFAAVDHGGQVVGMCTLHADRFPALRTATTGSWLGRAFHRQGLGRELRQAALHLLFAGLGGRQATTRAWHDNAASLGVTASLPYSADGTAEELRRDRPDTMLSFSMTREQWRTVRRTDIELTGTEAVRQFLAI